MADLSNHLIRLSMFICIPNSTCSSMNYYFPQYLLHLESLLISVDGNTILLFAQAKKKYQRQPWFLLFYLTHCNTYPVHLETHKLHIKTHPGFHYFHYFNSLPEPSSPSSFTCIIVDTSNWPPYFHLCYFRFVLSVGRCYLTWVRLCLSSQNSRIVHQFSQCLEVTL